jgi:hypothetical protein
VLFDLVRNVQKRSISFKVRSTKACVSGLFKKRV